MKIAKELKHKQEVLSELLEIMKNASIHFSNLIRSGKFKNKIAINSGTASGIGSAFAVHVEHEKINMAIVYLPKDNSNKTNYVSSENNTKKYLNNINLDMLTDNGTKLFPINVENKSNPDFITDTINEFNHLSRFNSIQFTNRQRQVIELIADGYSNKEIAVKLNLSVYTVKSHVHSILVKSSLSTRVQIAKYAYFSKYDKIAI